MRKKKPTRHPFHDLPVSAHLELIVNWGESVFEFLLRLAFEDEPVLIEYAFRGAGM